MVHSLDPFSSDTFQQPSSDPSPCIIQNVNLPKGSGIDLLVPLKPSYFNLTPAPGRGLDLDVCSSYCQVANPCPLTVTLGTPAAKPTSSHNLRSFESIVRLVHHYCVDRNGLSEGCK